MQSNIMDVRQAAAVLDLVLGGVSVELGDSPFAWMAVPQPIAPKPLQIVTLPERNKAIGSVPVTIAPALPSFAPLTSSSFPSAMLATELVRKEVAVEVPMGTVWNEGEPGGVLLLVHGRRPDERCLRLAQGMLEAVGLGDLPVSWVGYDGRVDAKALFADIQAKTARKVLVLGQQPLGVLVGKNLGVEGWHAAGQPAVEGIENLGVTYPLDLLVKQPLFKRLAWQHLQVWIESK